MTMLAPMFPRLMGRGPLLPGAGGRSLESGGRSFGSVVFIDFGLHRGREERERGGGKGGMEEGGKEGGREGEGVVRRKERLKSCDYNN